MLKLYGIPNCDTMKKARAWLAEHGVDYAFHDYKKLGIDEATLNDWVDRVGWETLLNRRGMMWRKLDPATRDNIDQPSALHLMLATPSIIKRPVADLGHELIVGFNADAYARHFG